MAVSKDILATLSDWGGHPVFLELDPRKTPQIVTADQFTNDIEETARQLKAWGIREKYLVPLFLENSCDFPSLFLALISIGAVPVLVKLEYRSTELCEIFDNAQPQAIICDKDHLEIIKPFLNNRIVISRQDQVLKLIQTVQNDQQPAGIADDIASINYTYRGSGSPLGALVSHEQYLQGAKFLQDTVQTHTGDKMLVILPMSHIFTLISCIFAPLIYRMTAVIARTLHPRWIFRYIEEYGINHITSIPEIYQMLCRLKDPAANLDSLRVFVSGGSVLTADQYADIRDAFGIDLLHGYGLTEFTPASGNIRQQSKAGTIGPICGNLRCRIAAPDRTEPGEILLKAPYVCRGYYRNDSETKTAFTNGWFKTGDIGRFQEDHLVFVKESKNTRKVNGNLVDLEEVRRTIQAQQHVAAVEIDYDSNTLSARVAFDRNNDFQDKVVTLKTELKSIISGYKIPKLITRI